MVEEDTVGRFEQDLAGPTDLVEAAEVVGHPNWLSKCLAWPFSVLSWTNAVRLQFRHRRGLGWAEAGLLMAWLA